MTAAPGRSLVEDVRLFGLVSADLVVARYVRLTERALGRDAAGSGGPADRVPPPPVAGLADGATTLAVAWLRLIEMTASLADSTAGMGPSVGALELPPTPAGGIAEGSLWVHNTTASPAPVELAATSLAGPDGLAVPADAVSVGPTRPDPLPARASTEVRLRVHVPDGQGPGRYQGLVLTPVADQPLLLRLDVTAIGGAGS